MMAKQSYLNLRKGYLVQQMDTKEARLMTLTIGPQLCASCFLRDRTPLNGCHQIFHPYYFDSFRCTL